MKNGEMRSKNVSSFAHLVN